MPEVSSPISSLSTAKRALWSSSHGQSRGRSYIVLVIISFKCIYADLKEIMAKNTGVYIRCWNTCARHCEVQGVSKQEFQTVPK